MTPGAVTLLPVEGIGEVAEGDDLAALVVAALGPDGLRDGDVVVITSKVVSKAEGRASSDARERVVERETDRVYATRGPTRIVRTRHGLVMAGAGVDASNVTAGTVLSLPADPDASAVAVREELLHRAGVNVAVLVTDTAGRAWRQGQTDVAIGAAGIEVLDDHAGRVDPYGNLLAVTAPAVADEIAAAGDLVKGKLAGRPAAVVRGLAHLVLPAGRHGPGARALVRDEHEDMFGLGAREAVLAAVSGDKGALRGFGAPAPAADVVEHLARVAPGASVSDGAGGQVDVRLDVTDARAAGRLEARVTAAAFALGWLPLERPDDAPGPDLGFRPAG
jgi:coenzyme F420-0:L-glutamate ligase / coenzyme F420-1:gamma-L-glutamate ligase